MLRRLICRLLGHEGELIGISPGKVYELIRCHRCKKTFAWPAPCPGIDWKTGWRKPATEAEVDEWHKKYGVQK